MDHFQFIGQLAAVFGMRIPIPPGKALVAKLPEICVAVIARRQLKFGQMILSEGELQIAPLRNAAGIVHRIFVFAEQGLHLLLRAEIKIARLIAHPVLVGEELTGLNTQQHVVSLGILLAQIVCVVGAHHGNPGLLMNPENSRFTVCCSGIPWSCNSDKNDRGQKCRRAPAHSF